MKSWRFVFKSSKFGIFIYGTYSVTCLTSFNFDCFIYEFTYRRFTHRRERQQKLSAMATTDVIYKDKDKTVSVHDLLAYRLKKRRGEEVESDFFIAKEILHVI